jgi:hypothetical protein
MQKINLVSNSKPDFQQVFDNYIQESEFFRKTTISRMFSFRLKQKISDSSVIDKGIEKELRFYNSLKNLTRESPYNIEKLQELIIGLESVESELSDRSNFLIGSVVFIVFFSNVAIYTMEYWDSVANKIISKFIPAKFAMEIDITTFLKAIITLCFLLIIASFLGEGFHLKKLSSRIQSFIKLSKNVLE